MPSSYLGLVYLMSVDGTTSIALDATESVDWAKTVSVSTSTMFAGTQTADHVTPTLPEVSFSGIVSFSKVRDLETTHNPDKFMVLCNELIDSFQPMTFIGTEDGAIPALPQCYIKNISVNRGLTTSNALTVNISLQSLDITNSISATTITQPSIKTNGQLADKTKTGSGGKEEVTKKTLLASLAKAGYTIPDLIVESLSF